MNDVNELHRMIDKLKVGDGRSLADALAEVLHRIVFMLGNAVYHDPKAEKVDIMYCGVTQDVAALRIRAYPELERKVDALQKRLQQIETLAATISCENCGAPMVRDGQTWRCLNCQHRSGVS